MVLQLTNSTAGAPVTDSKGTSTLKRNQPKLRTRRTAAEQTNCSPNYSEMSTGRLIIGFISGLGLGLVLHVAFCLILAKVHQM